MNLTFWKSIVVAWVVSSSSAGVNADGIAVNIRPEPTEDGLSKSVSIELEIRNAGPEYWLVYPVFRSEACSARPSHEAQVRFVVTGPKGEIVARTGACDQIKVRLPSPSEIMIFGESYFFGRSFDLHRGEFAHEFDAPGRYRIKAVVFFTTRDWLEEAMERGDVSPEQLPFELGRVFNGRIESNEVTLELQ